MNLSKKSAEKLAEEIVSVYHAATFLEKAEKNLLTALIIFVCNTPDKTLEHVQELLENNFSIDLEIILKKDAEAYVFFKKYKRGCLSEPEFVVRSVEDKIRVFVKSQKEDFL